MLLASVSPETYSTRMQPMSFAARVWELACAIPPGRVTTYGTLARAAGGTGQAARSITAILSRCPNQSAIPYHRIVYANGKVWFSEQDRKSRMRLYKREHIQITEKGFVANFESLVWP
jgi:methylated-DNA-protein-cysteine methyltransferase related protein